MIQLSGCLSDRDSIKSCAQMRYVSRGRLYLAASAEARSACSTKQRAKNRSFGYRSQAARQISASAYLELYPARAR
jgi:hypothetical protein